MHRSPFRPGTVVFTVLLVAMLSIPSRAWAQPQPPPAGPECSTSYPGDEYQTIVVRKVDGKTCVVDPTYDKGGISSLHTYLDAYASWDVCNLCGEDVDVTLVDASPYSLTQLFQTFYPPLTADNESRRDNIHQGQWGAFHGRATNNSTYANRPNKYTIRVKPSSGMIWQTWDPELQIDEGGLVPRLLTGTGLMWILALIVALIIGFILGRRRTAA